MELLTPSYPLIAWTALALINLIMCGVSLFWLAKNKRLAPLIKLLWALAIIFIPFIGALTFYRFFKVKKTQST